MIIKKGAILSINHQRKGGFIALATEEFNTEDIWFTVISLQEIDGVQSKSKWIKGDKITCRSAICELEVLGNQND